MAVLLNNVTLPVRHTEEMLRKKVAKLLHLSLRELGEIEIVRRSIDARKKPELFYVYLLRLCLPKEERFRKLPNVTPDMRQPYVLPPRGEARLMSRPVIIGTGPAGLFAGLMLAEAGYQPILLERGLPAAARKAAVDAFWAGEPLNPDCNVSFGEGGAGTFSDGKLNTLVKDNAGRNRKVLELFCRFGADSSILYEQKPHVGTDRLISIVTAMREEILRLGGEVRFSSRAADFCVEADKLSAVLVERADGTRYELKTEVLIAATGHSARDTFRVLASRGFSMEAKAFAVGFRVQHRQRDISLSQYGAREADFLPPAPYKLAAKTSVGRGVYSFCMCPGGYVVNASSEVGGTVVNGMSYADRGSENANAAIIVSVTPEDFQRYGTGALAGLAFQEELEKRAFLAGQGKIPVQLYGDFLSGRESQSFGGIQPCFAGQYRFSRLNGILDAPLETAFVEGMTRFGRQIKGFDAPEVILAGVESRTSSPVRIFRDAAFQANVRGFYPCGEGAGYAGGITSAAMDGLKVAEAVIAQYCPAW